MELNCIEFMNVNHDDNIDYTDEQLLLLSRAWEDLYDEFFNLRKNKHSKYMMGKNVELTKLSFKLHMLYELENRTILLINLDEDNQLKDFVVTRLYDVLTEFKALYPKVTVNMFSSARDFLKLLQSVIKAQTNIFDEKCGAKDKNIEKEKQNIYDIVSKLSSSLGYALDINNMSCFEFIAHENNLNSRKTEEPKK